MTVIHNVRSRVGLVAGVAAVIVLGLASRRYPGLLPGWMGKYPGDALWAMMVYLAWAVLRPAATARYLAGVAMAISAGVELLQLYQAPWIMAIRATTAGHLVLGTAFSWWDMAAYAVGIMLLGGADGALRAWKRARPRA